MLMTIPHAAIFGPQNKSDGIALVVIFYPIEMSDSLD